MKATATIEKKKERYGDEELPKVKTLADREAEELTEKNVVRDPDTVNELVGATVYLRNFSDSAWKMSKLTQPLFVSRYYFHEKLIVDFPATEQELEDKKRLFARLKVKYFYVAPTETLTAEAFKARLKEIRRTKKNG